MRDETGEKIFEKSLEMCFRLLFSFLRVEKSKYLEKCNQKLKQKE